MGVLSVVLWGIVSLPAVVVTLWFVGGMLHAADNAKAARFLAK